MIFFVILENFVNLIYQLLDAFDVLLSANRKNAMINRIENIDFVDVYL